MSDIHTYRLGIEGLGEELPAGTSAMVIGPPMSGKDCLLNTIVAEGLASGEGVILITTAETGESAAGRFREPENLRIIDCMSRPLGLSVADTARIKRVSGPMDLTGMGVRASQFLEEFRGSNVRLCISSLSTLLMYSGLQAVFRFMHVLTGRVSVAGALCACVVEEGMHDAQAVSALKQMFGAVIEVKFEGDALYMRLITGQSRKKWRELDIIHGIAVIRESANDQ
jgi:KaiC/GvpD/RAD55 family RecA-like ATPase